MNYLALAKRIEKEAEELEQKTRKSNLRDELSRMSFFDFCRRFRPDLSYDHGYAYLRYIIELLLQGVSVVVQKGSQQGFTELLLNYALYSLLVRKKNIFYMLPTDSDIRDLTSGRIDPLFLDFEDLRALFEVDNVHLKQAGRASWYLRAGMTRAGRPTSKIKVVSVGILVIDEYNEIPEITIPIVRERLSGSEHKQEVFFSTPYEGSSGISPLMNTRKVLEYFLACLQCGAQQVIDFDLTLDLDHAEYRCIECKRPFSHEEKLQMVAGGDWRVTKNHELNGIALQSSQLYSPTVTAQEIVTSYEGADNDLKKQAFFNHKLGLPYTAEGSRLSPEYVDNCVMSFDIPETDRIAGIDVSSGGLHYVSVGYMTDYGPVVFEVAKVSWNDLSEFLKMRGVTVAVIDFLPEKHAARNFVSDFSGEAWVALYPSGIEVLFRQDEDTRVVKIHRTEIIDTILSRFRETKICLLPHVYESNEWRVLKEHILSVIRKYREVRGQYEAYYEESGGDHYLHSLVYMEIAGRLQNKETADEIAGSFI